MSSIFPFLPRVFLDLGFDVRQIEDGRWIAEHVDPKFGDHGATYGAYSSPAEAVAVVWYEVRSTGVLNGRRR